MRYIKFIGGTDYCGTDFTLVREYEDDWSDADLNEEADELATANGESFEYLATGWDNDFETEEDREAYYEGCYCGWEEISKEEYDEFGED